MRCQGIGAWRSHPLRGSDYSKLYQTECHRCKCVLGIDADRFVTKMPHRVRSSAQTALRAHVSCFPDKGSPARSGLPDVPSACACSILPGAGWWQPGMRFASRHPAPALRRIGSAPQTKRGNPDPPGLPRFNFRKIPRIPRVPSWSMVERHPVIGVNIAPVFRISPRVFIATKARRIFELLA